MRVSPPCVNRRAVADSKSRFECERAIPLRRCPGGLLGHWAVVCRVAGMTEIRDKSRLLRGGCRAAQQHCSERSKPFLHGRPFVGEQVGRIHGVHDRTGVNLKYKQLAAAGLRAINDQGFQPETLKYAAQAKRVT